MGIDHGVSNVPCAKTKVEVDVELREDLDM